MAPVVQIITEEEFIELFGTESNDKTFYGDWNEIGVEDDSIKAAEPDMSNKGEELPERNLTEEQQAIICYNILCH